MKFKGIGTVLFDVDNTLFPTREFAELARRSALNAMLEAGLLVRYEKAAMALARVIKKYGSNYQKHFQKLLEELGQKYSAKIVAAGIAAYHNAKATIRPYPDVPRALSVLKERGYRLCIASEGNEIKQWDKLIRLGLRDVFDGVFVANRKDVKFFKGILKKLGIKPEEALVVGDKLDKDIAPARKLGMRTALLGASKGYADIKIRSVAELLDCL